MAPSKKTMLFVCLLVAAVAVVVPIAQGQIIGGFFAPLLNLLRVQGIVFCSTNGGATVGSNGTILTPAFANATVQLRCGAGNGTVLGIAQTNSNGVFSIMVQRLSLLTLPQLLSGCRVVVTTPLVSCNATLASTGTLTSTLTSLGNTIAGPLNIININADLFVGTGLPHYKKFDLLQRVYMQRAKIPCIWCEYAKNIAVPYICLREYTKNSRLPCIWAPDILEPNNSLQVFHNPCIDQGGRVWR